MSEILNIEEKLNSSTVVVRKKESPVVYIALLVVAVALGAYSLMAGSTENVSFALLFLSAVLALIGLKGVVIPRKLLKYAPTGESLNKQEFYYDNGERKEVEDCLRTKGFQMLKMLPQGKGTGLRVILYATSSGSYAVAQLQQYVPYEYKPVYDTE